MEKINEMKENIENIDTSLIDISFISNSNNQKSKLINNENETFSYTLNNKSYDFQFKEPIFIEKIHIKSLSNDLKNTVIEVIDYFTNEKIRIPIENYKEFTHIAVSINRVIKLFIIKPPRRITKIKLESIELFGYLFSELSNISNMFKQSKNLKSEIDNFYNEKINEINNKENELIKKEEKTKEDLRLLNEGIAEKKTIISELNTELIELKSSVKSDTESSENLKEVVKDLESKENTLNKSLTDIKNSIEQREEESVSLNKKISNEKDILKKNQENNNLFAYELSEFLKEGNNNILIYTIISIIPMLLIVFLTYILLNGTVDLTTVYKTNENMDIFTIFWSRLPFVLVITSIIFVCYEITKIFFKKVMEIHHQKLNFSKIGIIAKDVTTTSFDGLDLTDNEKSELQTKLKMQLLREYLSTEFNIKHDYNINKSLWTRVVEFLKNKDKKSASNESVPSVDAESQ